jgi:hypothetical protein
LVVVDFVFDQKMRYLHFEKGEHHWHFDFSRNAVP